jgi:hypothetical protein
MLTKVFVKVVQVLHYSHAKYVIKHDTTRQVNSMIYQLKTWLEQDFLSNQNQVRIVGQLSRSTSDPFNLIKTQMTLKFIFLKKQTMLIQDFFKKIILTQPMIHTLSQTRFYNYGFKFLEMCFEALHSAMSNKMNENGITDCYY